MTFAATTWLFFRTRVGRFFVSRRALAGAALLWLAAFLVLALGLGAWRISRREFVVGA